MHQRSGSSKKSHPSQEIRDIHNISQDSNTSYHSLGGRNEESFSPSKNFPIILHEPEMKSSPDKKESNTYIVSEQQTASQNFVASETYHDYPSQFHRDYPDYRSQKAIPSLQSQQSSESGSDAFTLGPGSLLNSPSNMLNLPLQSNGFRISTPTLQDQLNNQKLKPTPSANSVTPLPQIAFLKSKLPAPTKDTAGLSVREAILKDIEELKRSYKSVFEGLDFIEREFGQENISPHDYMETQETARFYQINDTKGFRRDAPVFEEVEYQPQPQKLDGSDDQIDYAFEQGVISRINYQSESPQRGALSETWRNDKHLISFNRNVDSTPNVNSSQDDLSLISFTRINSLGEGQKNNSEESKNNSFSKEEKNDETVKLSPGKVSQVGGNDDASEYFSNEKKLQEKSETSQISQDKPRNKTQNYDITMDDSRITQDNSLNYKSNDAKVLAAVIQKNEKPEEKRDLPRQHGEFWNVTEDINDKEERIGNVVQSPPVRIIKEQNHDKDLNVGVLQPTDDKILPEMSMDRKDHDKYTNVTQSGSDNDLDAQNLQDRHKLELDTQQKEGKNDFVVHPAHEEPVNNDIGSLEFPMKVDYAVSKQTSSQKKVLQVEAEGHLKSDVFDTKTEAEKLQEQPKALESANSLKSEKVLNEIYLKDQLSEVKLPSGSATSQADSIKRQLHDNQRSHVQSTGSITPFCEDAYQKVPEITKKLNFDIQKAAPSNSSEKPPGRSATNIAENTSKLLNDSIQSKSTDTMSLQSKAHTQLNYPNSSYTRDSYSQNLTDRGLYREHQSLIDLLNEKIAENQHSQHRMSDKATQLEESKPSNYEKQYAEQRQNKLYGSVKGKMEEVTKPQKIDSIEPAYYPKADAEGKQASLHSNSGSANYRKTDYNESIKSTHYRPKFTHRRIEDSGFPKLLSEEPTDMIEASRDKTKFERNMFEGLHSEGYSSGSKHRLHSTHYSRSEKNDYPLVSNYLTSTRFTSSNTEEADEEKQKEIIRQHITELEEQITSQTHTSRNNKLQILLKATELLTTGEDQEYKFTRLAEETRRKITSRVENQKVHQTIEPQRAAAVADHSRNVSSTHHNSGAYRDFTRKHDDLKREIEAVLQMKLDSKSSKDVTLSKVSKLWDETETRRFERENVKTLSFAETKPTKYEKINPEHIFVTTDFVSPRTTGSYTIETTSGTRYNHTFKTTNEDIVPSAKSYRDEFINSRPAEITKHKSENEPLLYKHASQGVDLRNRGQASQKSTERRNISQFCLDQVSPTSQFDGIAQFRSPNASNSQKGTASSQTQKTHQSSKSGVFGANYSTRRSGFDPLSFLKNIETPRTPKKIDVNRIQNKSARHAIESLKQAGIV